MKNFQQKRKWRHILESKPILFILCILILFFAWSVFGLIDKMQDTIKNKKIASEKIQELQKEKEKLVSDIDKLKTDKGVEESIREKFGLAKEGEGVVVVVEDKNQPTNGTASESTCFLSFIKNWFK
jgi:cell division protein FtsB